MPTELQRGADCAQVGGEGYADPCQGRFEPRTDGSGSGLIAVLPIMTKSCRSLSSVRNSGPVSGPAARPVDRSCSASAPTTLKWTKTSPIPS